MRSSAGLVRKNMISKSFRKEPFNVFNLPSDARWRQTLQKLLPVTLRHDPRVEDREHTSVSRAADQSSEPLFQRDDGRRNRVAVEAISAVIINVTLSRADHRVGR